MSVIVPTRHGERSSPPFHPCSWWLSDESSPPTAARSLPRNRNRGGQDCRSRFPHTPSYRQVLYGAAVQCPHPPSAATTRSRALGRCGPCSSRPPAASEGCQAVWSDACCPLSPAPTTSEAEGGGSLRCCRLRLPLASPSPSSPSSLSDSSPLTGQEPA